MKPVEVRIEQSWKEALQDEFGKSYFADLVDFVKLEYRQKRIYPAAGDIFKAFELCPLSQTRVVILGQDPYHGVGQAHGLCFSVPEGVDAPPSLRNIFTETASDTGAEAGSVNLERWARQGVLLLNSVLTVRAHEAASHAGQGWERFTDAVIRVLGERREGVVYMLWGGYAQRKAAFVNASRNLVLRAPHPSPLSSYRGFFGCRHFSRANEYLVSRGGNAINW